jgi:hypothetical protein
MSQDWIPHHFILFGPSLPSDATLLSFLLKTPTFSTAFPTFPGSFSPINRLTMAAILGPFPFVLTMICSGPSLWVDPK